MISLSQYYFKSHKFYRFRLYIFSHTGEEYTSFKSFVQITTCYLGPVHTNPFQTKKHLFSSGYGYRPHYNAENDHRKRSHSKTLSRVERFENDAFWKRSFLVWTE